MGNYSSCFIAQKQGSRTNMAKLVDQQGQITLVKLPITVAELMLENPGFALSSVEEIRRTRRIPAMRADEILVRGKVYLLVPVDKVNSRLSDLQMGAVDSICSNPGMTSNKKTRGSSRISPVNGEDFGELVKELGGQSMGRACQRKRVDRGWAPVLEPILERC